MNSWLVAYLVPASISLAQVTPWWSDQTAAWIGGIGGSLLGLNGALLGTLGGLGRARRLVLTLLMAGRPKTATNFLVFGEPAGFRNVRVAK